MVLRSAFFGFLLQNNLLHIPRTSDNLSLGLETVHLVTVSSSMGPVSHMATGHTMKVFSRTYPLMICTKNRKNLLNSANMFDLWYIWAVRYHSWKTVLTSRPSALENETFEVVLLDEFEVRLSSLWRTSMSCSHPSLVDVICTSSLRAGSRPLTSLYGLGVFFTFLIILLSFELRNAYGKKNDDWLPVVDEPCSFRCSSVQQNNM